MSSYGIEVEIWRPVYFEISAIKIQNRLTEEVISLDFLARPIKIGPERDAENQALYGILNWIYRSLLENKNQMFTEIRDAILQPKKFGTLRLNRSPIRFNSIEMVATALDFPELSPDDIALILRNIIFSIDHDEKQIMILELVSNPIGRYKHQDKHVLADQAHFLEIFFKFCSALRNSNEAYTLPCSIDWQDPHTWHITDTTGNDWNYNIFLEGILKISEPPAGFRLEDPTTWAFSFPQYNFSIDLSHFTLAQSCPGKKNLSSLIKTKYDFVDQSSWMNLDVKRRLSSQDPLLYFYTLCSGNVDYYILTYNMSLTELSRMIVYQMGLQAQDVTNPRSSHENTKTTILGAFGYTIWYFLSLCVGAFEGNLLHKNLFLFMPKTSPIPFLKAAYAADPEYYHKLLSNMTHAFCFVLFHSLQYSSYFCRQFSYYLQMQYFFPRLARWYRAGGDDIKLGTPASGRYSDLRDYSNPLSADLSQSVHELRNLVFAFGGHYLTAPSDSSLYNPQEPKGVLSVLIKFIQLTVMAASDEYRTLIRLNGHEQQKKAIQSLGILLTAQDANQIPVYAQPGFGRPKLEARAIKFMPKAPEGIIPLVSALNLIGKPAIPISPIFSETANLPQNIDQISVDLTLSNMGEGNLFKTNVDPWETDEYKYVWMPGQQEFGRRKETDIRRWMASVDQSGSSEHSLYTFDLAPLPPKQEIAATSPPITSQIDMAKVSELLNIPEVFLDAIVNLF